MAIVNLTPDSFYDGGKFSTEEDVLRDVEQKIRAGANIIDLGAASSRPGSASPGADEEWRRLQPALATVRKEFPEVFVSVDTYYSRVARNAASEGADIINDISGAVLDPEMAKTVCEIDLPFILMHMDGSPATMQQNKPYEDVVNEVFSSLQQRCFEFEQKGFSKIIVDPGFGFGKSLANNYELLKNLHRFSELNYPVMAGLSRKSMISKITGTNPVTALNGTTVLNTLAVLNGASLIRVHDVAEAKQVVELLEFYKSV